LEADFVCTCLDTRDDISACSNTVQYVRLHPIVMSIRLYHYKQLTECISEVEDIEAKANSKQRLMKEVKKKEIPNTTTTLDGFFVKTSEA
jgi:hypothetical protein